MHDGEGDAQLRRAQVGEQMGAALVATVQQHQTQISDLRMAASDHQQPLHQQLNGSALRLVQMFEDSLQYLLINIVHGLVMGIVHVVTPSF